MRSRALLLTTAILAIIAATGAKRAESPEASRYIDHVRYLSSPELSGRGAGTPGLDKARKYIAERFQQLGLQPGNAGSYFQQFTVGVGASPGTGNKFRSGQTEYKMRQDFVPLSFSQNGFVRGPLVFAGYGVTAREEKYDDYAGIDVRGKIAVVLRYEPAFLSPQGDSNRRELTHHSHLVTKAINARRHGAKALILINGEGDGKSPDDLISFGTVVGPADAGIPFVQVKNAVAEQWFREAGNSMKAVESTIALAKQPASFMFPATESVAFTVDIERRRAAVSNVLGYLPGKTSEYVIIGAHYDHIGLGHTYSLAPRLAGTVHPGADDNASGTAALLELASKFVPRQQELRRGILFVAFAGEEVGLLGSSEWANKPTLPLGKAVAMINMDMIGRPQDRKIYVGAIGTGSTFEPIVERVVAQHEFEIDRSQDGYSASDHTSFLSRGIPSLFFFSGLHADYHKPSDTWDKIDAQTASAVVSLIHDVANAVVADTARPVFQRLPDPSPSYGPENSGPYLGVVPDYGDVDIQGVRIADVRADSPAAVAGLVPGDVVLSVAGLNVTNSFELRYALRDHAPEDTVDLVYLRSGVTRNVRVRLGSNP